MFIFWKHEEHFVSASEREVGITKVQYCEFSIGTHFCLEENYKNYKTDLC